MIQIEYLEIPQDNTNLISNKIFTKQSVKIQMNPIWIL